MNPETLPEIDLSTYERETKTATVCSPRVIIISLSGEFVLVRYKDTAWLGLPGGKVQTEEYEPDGNLLSTAAFPTLEREVGEECGLSIHLEPSKCPCLGLVDIATVDNTQRIVTQHLTPIFIYLSPAFNSANLKEGVVGGNINDHLGGPLFPDARVAITHLKRQWQAGKPIFNFESAAFLGPERPLFFQMKPTLGPLWGAPEWYK